MVVQLTTKDVFLQCQSGMQCHAKLLKTLQKIYEQMEFSSFWSEFSHYLKYSLVVFKREPAVERTIDFIAKFVTSISSESAATEASNDDSTIDDTSQHKLLLEIIDFLLKSHNACDRAVRFRCCQMINKILSNLGEDAQIDDDLYDKIYESMLERLRDKFPVVRLHAVMAMARLQDPHDENCPVIKAYLFLINCDPNPDVRRAVLSCIAPSTKTLPAILERTRDVKDVVRKTAYIIMSEKVHIKALSIANRIRLLQEGLNDRSDMVKDACSSKLLQAWLRTFGGNVLDLLCSLDVENSLETCELTLQQLFKSSSSADLVDNFDLLDENIMVPLEKLTCESSMYWQTLCKYIHSLGAEGDADLEKVLPNCVEFCKYIQTYTDGLKNCEDVDQQLEKEFIIQQLLLMIGYMDLADQASRKTVERLFHDMLVADHIGHNLVKYIIPRLCEIRDYSENLVPYLAETVSDIREPITIVEKGGLGQEERRQNDVKIAGIRVKINELKEELEESVNKQDFSRAADIKNTISELESERSQILNAAEPQIEEVRTEKTDLGTMMKCHTIVAEMLQTLPLKVLNPTLQTLIETLILPGIQNEDAGVRNIAARALGLCCLLSKDLVLQYLPLFMQASQIDVETVRATALRVIFDLLHLHGLEAIQNDSQEDKQPETNDSDKDSTDAVVDGEEETSESGTEQMNTSNSSNTSTAEENQQDDNRSNAASKLVAFLCASLDSEAADIRTVAAEGLAKLLLSGRVVSSKILSHLLLLWYNPLTEDDTHLRHCLGTFFPIFAFAGGCNQEVVEEAFLPTLKTIMNAPSSSPLAEVNAENVAELLVQLTNAKLLMENQNSETITDHSKHDSLAVTVCNEIISNPDSFNLKLWVKILNQLELSSDNDANTKDLIVLTEQMIQVVKDKQCLKSIDKFQNTLKSSLKETLITDDLASSQNSATDCTGNNQEFVPSSTQSEGANGEAGAADGLDSTKDKTLLDDTVAEDGTSFFMETKTIKRTKSKSGNASIRLSDKSISESPEKSTAPKTPAKQTAPKTPAKQTENSTSKTPAKQIPKTASKENDKTVSKTPAKQLEKTTRTPSKQAEPKNKNVSKESVTEESKTDKTPAKNGRKKTSKSQVVEENSEESDKTQTLPSEDESKSEETKTSKTPAKNGKKKTTKSQVVEENSEESDNTQTLPSENESRSEEPNTSKTPAKNGKKKTAKSQVVERKSEELDDTQTLTSEPAAQGRTKESSRQSTVKASEKTTRASSKQTAAKTTDKTKSIKQSEQSTRTPAAGAKRSTRSAVKGGARDATDDSDLENSVFASPTPRRGAPRAATRSAALGSTKKNLSGLMQEEESSKNNSSSTAKRSTRTLRSVQSADVAKKN